MSECNRKFPKEYVDQIWRTKFSPNFKESNHISSQITSVVFNETDLDGDDFFILRLPNYMEYWMTKEQYENLTFPLNE